MIELSDTSPQVNVDPAEYKRLLGFPRDRVLDGRSRDLAEWARSWYAKHGRPWVYARHVDHVELSGNTVALDGASFTSPKLRTTFAQAEAHGAVIVALSAGPEIEAEARRAWEAEKPDEYFFLEIYGSAVVEHLTMTTGARLCAWADERSLAVLPHYSPGYNGWDISEQRRLFDVIRRVNGSPKPFDGIEVLESGMLRPKKSLLAVFGVTKHIDRVKRLTELVPCQSCLLSPCQYRRMPYQVARASRPSEINTDEAPVPRKYATSEKALKRWSSERLSLKHNPDGSIDAHFRYDGTTCTNMGRSLAFQYTVKLGRREDGYPIREQQCAPVEGDEGHRFMCRYMTNAEHLMVAIEKEKPLAGQKLADVFTFDRPASGASCYCEPKDRRHKWGLVLETIHYALTQQEAAIK